MESPWELGRAYSVSLADRVVLAKLKSRESWLPRFEIPLFSFAMRGVDFGFANHPGVNSSVSSGIIPHEREFLS